MSFGIYNPEGTNIRIFYPPNTNLEPIIKPTIISLKFNNNRIHILGHKYLFSLSFGICTPEGTNIRIFYPPNTNLEPAIKPTIISLKI